MDVVGGLSSIIALLELSFKTSQRVIDLIKAIKTSPEQHKQLREQVRDYEHLLGRFEKELGPGEEESSRKIVDIVKKQRLPLEQLSTVLDKYENLQSENAFRKMKAGLGLQRRAKEIRDIQQNVERARDFFRLMLDVDNRIFVQQWKDAQTNDAASAVLEWITPVDYTHRQSDLRPEEGTGSWFLESTKYESWWRMPQQLLFCLGIQGAGKTFIVKRVIDDLDERYPDADVGIAYIYYDYRFEDQQTAINIVASLLKQLSRSRKIRCGLPQSVKDLHERCTKTGKLKKRPTYEELLGTLLSLIKGYRKTFIIIDALDECKSTGDYQGLILQAISKLMELTNINILVTSRIMPQTTLELPRLTVMQVQAHNEDLRTYVHGRMSRELCINIENLPDLQRKMTDHVISSANSMFLMARLSVDCVIGATTEKEIETAFTQLPIGYHEAFEANMNRIEKQSHQQVRLAMNALLWTVWAKRQLNAEELRLALAIDTSYPRVDEKNVASISTILTACVGMLTFEERSGMMKLIHKAEDDYLQDTQNKWFPSTHGTIAGRLVTYLSSGKFSGDFMRTKNGFKVLADSNALFDFAARSWVHHAQRSDSKANQLVERLLTSTSRAPDNCLLLAAKEKEIDNVKWLLDRAVGASAHDFEHRTALHYAVFHGWDEIVKRLIQVRAPCTSDTDNMTPLHHAVRLGQRDTIQALIGTGISIDIPVKRKKWRSLFQEGDWVMEPHDDPDVPNERESVKGLTGLHLAVIVGDASMVEYLIANGANPNALSEFSETPLHLALKQDVDGMSIWPGSTDVWDDPDYRIEYQLDLMDDCLEDDDSGALKRLCWDIVMKRENILRCLLDHTAVDLEAADAKGNSPLHCIRYKRVGAQTLLYRLLQRRPPVSARNLNGQTPLHLACQAGKKRCVEMLIKNGASVSDVDKQGCSAIHYAARSGAENVITRVLDLVAKTRDAELFCSIDSSGRNVLHHYLDCTGVSTDTIQLILASGIKIDHVDNNGNSPLTTYLGYRCLDVNVIECLFRNGADPNNVQAGGQTRIAKRLSQGFVPPSVTVLKTFSKYGVDFKKKDAGGQTILHHTAKHGLLTKETLEYLIDLGLSKDSSDENGQTPLQIASKMELEYRDPNLWDCERWTRTRKLLEDPGE